MFSFISSKNERYIYSLISLLLISYTGYRCYSLSFTHDESISYNNIIHNSFYEIISNDTEFITANNHILNSLFMKYSEMIFGASEISLRMHSLFAHIIYLFFSFLLLKNIKMPWIKLIGFLILNVNPFLLDFFSLARGYALSIAFMMMSIYYFIEYTKTEKIKHITIFLTTALLSTLANFSMVVFVVSIIGLLECFMIAKRYPIKQCIIKNIPVLFTALCLYSFYKWPITKLIEHKELYFGGYVGLWRDTALSSIQFYLYGCRYTEIFSYFLRFLLLAGVFSGFYVLFIKIKTKSIKELDFIFVLFTFIIVVNYLQHFIMKTNFFTERVAVFLVILFFISLINTWHYFSEKGLLLKITTGVIASVFIIVIGFTASASLNFSYTCDWRYDADTKGMISELTNLNANKTTVKIGNTWLFEPSINFYRKTRHLNWLQPANRDGLNRDYDFYYVDTYDLNSFDKTNKILIKTYPESGATLFKKAN
ncbi:MAG: glycosyltransferase family 39 protein [Bacteroidetes bacterium]|nr:glycosyltransferase family 39 protein [Bacteroidota bacterium]